jgi:signal transduction histidine kinase
VTRRREGESEAMAAELHLLRSLALAIGEAEDLDQALLVALSRVGEFTGWAAGESWLPDREGSRFVRGPVWSVDPSAAAGFHRISGEFTFAPGQGLVGRVWASGEAAWVSNVLRDPSFLRQDAARLLGLRAAAAIPVLAAGEVVAILVFYQTEEDPEDRNLLELVSTVAAQLGQLVRRKRADDERARTARQLELANGELQRLVWLASHDLQEPLRMVNLYSQLLLQRSAERLAPEEQEIVGFVLEGAARGQSLLDGLRTYAEVVSRPFHAGPVDAGSALESAITYLEPLILRNNASVKGEARYEVLGDRTELSRVFRQLIENSIVHRRPGVAPRVEIGAHRDGPDVVFRVRDNAAGIDPQAVERIFDVFHRIPSSNGHRGIGVGLSVCRKIVERHGGRIWVESREGEGSTFYFTVAAAG